MYSSTFELEVLTTHDRGGGTQPFLGGDKDAQA